VSERQPPHPGRDATHGGTAGAYTHRMPPPHHPPVAVLSGRRRSSTAGRPRRIERTAALRAAVLRIRTLQQEIARSERERDAALADTAELRLRHARQTARLYLLEATRHPAEEEAPDRALATVLQSHLARFSAIERQNEALGQALALLHGDLKRVTALAPSDPTGLLPSAPSAPWYRRFWLAIIGKDARTGEWSASQRRR
jgi:hypothetical protein